MIYGADLIAAGWDRTFVPDTPADQRHTLANVAAFARAFRALEAWVLPVEMKTPGSITLSLPVMAAAGEVIIAACGVSDKYPKGKSEAMARAIEGDETPTSFPATGLRGVATWILDNAAAGALSVDYAECFALKMTRGDCSPDGVA